MKNMKWDENKPYDSMFDGMTMEDVEIVSCVVRGESVNVVFRHKKHGTEVGMRYGMHILDKYPHWAAMCKGKAQ